MARLDSLLSTLPCRSQHLNHLPNPRLTLTLTPTLPSSSRPASLSLPPPFSSRRPLSYAAAASSRDSSPSGGHKHESEDEGEGNEGEEEPETEVNPPPPGRAEDQWLQIERAPDLDGQIPATSDGFLRQVSSPAYDVRRRFEQCLDSSSYDVLESNPWRGNLKPVYVLAQEENKLLTMRTRRVRNEVENELNLLFPKRGKRRGSSSGTVHSASSSRTLEDNRLLMMVEDVREGVLVFEDEEEATKYCSLLDDQGKSCMGVAELDASDVFALCNNIRAFAVLFRRGITPPLPDRLQMNLKARKRSLED